MNRTGSQPDVGLSMYATTRKAMGAFLRPLSTLLDCLVCVPRLRRTQSLVRQCSSEHRSFGSLCAGRITFAEVQQGFLLGVSV
jgi:hypothetical protein